VLGAERALANLERLAELFERPGVVRVPLFHPRLAAVDPAELVEVHGVLGMPLAQGVLEHGQRLLHRLDLPGDLVAQAADPVGLGDEPGPLAVACTFRPVERDQAFDALEGEPQVGRERVLAAERRLADGERLAEPGRCGFEVSVGGVRPRGELQGPGEVLMPRAEDPALDLQHGFGRRERLAHLARFPKPDDLPRQGVPLLQPLGRHDHLAPAGRSREEGNAKRE
jgi:hypothetical protein